MAIEIDEFIIHQIDKIQHGDPKVHLRSKALKAKDARVAKFTELAVEIFKTHEERPSSVFADFNSDTANYPFSQWCLNYFEGQLKFIKFTSDSTNRLAHWMSSQQASTGGFVVFATFTEDDAQKLLVVMLHPQEGLSITQKLEFEEVSHLDLKHIDKAALISGPVQGAFGPKPLVYAGFRKEMSRYFQEFIGPDAFRNPTKDSHKLIEAFDDYAKENNFPTADLDSIRIKLRNYAKQMTDENSELDLSAVSALIHPQKPQAFRLYATDRGISAFIKPDNKVFQKWKVIRHKSADGVVLQFKAELVGKPGTNHRIELDATAKTLTVKNVEPELIAKINATRT
jgi:nucleoid-associated protein YejK